MTDEQVVRQVHSAASITGPDAFGDFYVSVHIGDGVHQKLGIGYGIDAAWADARANLANPSAPPTELCLYEDCDSNHVCYQAKGHTSGCFK